jgi:hypothetical protein
MMTKAREVFEKYAGMDTPDLPSDPRQALQVRLARWQQRNFGGRVDLPAAAVSALGANEESGEIGDALLALMSHSALQGSVGSLAHVILKSSQRIRGMENEETCRKAIADGLADVAVFSMQLATVFRLDYWTIVHEVAEEVLRRVWATQTT